jgi:hypothetical protein
MSQMLSPKLKQVSLNVLAFYCPGCKEEHQLSINKRNEDGVSYAWNCSILEPSFTPAVELKKEVHCHVYVEDGQLRFQPDCEHEYLGQNIEMVDFPVEPEAEEEQA